MFQLVVYAESISVISLFTSRIWKKNVSYVICKGRNIKPLYNFNFLRIVFRGI